MRRAGSVCAADDSQVCEDVKRLQGSDSEYPDYANLPPPQDEGGVKKKNDKALSAVAVVGAFLACDLHYEELSTF